MVSTPSLTILESTNWQDYALLDSGNGLRLEKYGAQVLIRPDAEALWKPAWGAQRWEAAHARFIPSPEENGGHWQRLHPGADHWMMHYRELKFSIQLGASRHTGLFPEQAVQWDWMQEQIRLAGQPLNVLNLFGYTGLATLSCAAAGAKVTHVDASRKSVAWARENQALSGLAEKPIRWIVDDALKFVLREQRRGAKYDGIILDPPKFGRGPKGEVWEFYRFLPELLTACVSLLSDSARFMMLTAYAVKASALTLAGALAELTSPRGGTIEGGEIVLRDESRSRLLSTAVFASWCHA